MREIGKEESPKEKDDEEWGKREDDEKKENLDKSKCEKLDFRATGGDCDCGTSISDGGRFQNRNTSHLANCEKHDNCSFEWMDVNWYDYEHNTHSSRENNDNQPKKNK